MGAELPPPPPQPVISSPAKDSDRSFRFIVDSQAVKMISEFPNGNTCFYGLISAFGALTAKIMGFVELRSSLHQQHVVLSDDRGAP